ncbi:hypothetical protein BB560_002552 [Smittium megazygosporum]|uniref:Large ribosomal subunit protein mL40 n=1 Tax=Smittium megazygosporum TaxID=133381 RepID=A0A2T9ZEF7_9FUNG|nr:hypothetical protein BB560_002552 [Smittium megazygosporum]
MNSLRLTKSVLIQSRFFHTAGSVVFKGASTSKSSGSGAGVTKTPKKNAEVRAADPRYKKILTVLYETPQREIDYMSEQDIERHEAIVTAYELYTAEKNAAIVAEREAKFNAMKAAYAELEKTSLPLLLDACKKDLSPSDLLQLHVPTDTPPTVIWKY